MKRILYYGDRLKIDIRLYIYDNFRGDFESRVDIDSKKLISLVKW